jgi:SAM-dependent methyltransferase
MEFDHRKYVGGLWQQIGLLQFNFLIAEGLKPSHCLLDIGCGSLRGGVYFIPYLNAGNYLGLDREQALIKAGIVQELGSKRFLEKQPLFIISDRFEFQKFPKSPDFSIAQSLFTHLILKDIALCLTNLRAFTTTDHKFFATFFRGISARNPRASHSKIGFYYSLPEIQHISKETGWRCTYIGDWEHPRGQKMLKFEPT